MAKNKSNNSAPAGSGHGFGLGLLIGGMAGVAAYYMFGTEQGDKLRKKLVEEFEYGKVKIPKDIARILQEAELHAEQVGSAVQSGVKQENGGLMQSLMAAVKKEEQVVAEGAGKTKTAVVKKSRNVFTKSGKRL